MVHAHRSTLYIFGALVLGAGLFGLARSSAECNVPGLRTLTPSDPSVKIGRFKAGECGDPNATGVSANSEEARAYLKTLNANRNSCVAVDEQFRLLNDAFAVCAANFLKAYQQATGARVQINRSATTSQCEEALCRNNRGCGGFMNVRLPVTNHTRGIAIDVVSSNQRQMMEFSAANPKYGVCFPFYNHPTFKDDVHMILAGSGSGEARIGTCVQVTKPCDGVSFNPNEVPNVPPTQQALAPSQQLSNAFRNLVQPKQQAPQAPPLSATPAQYIPGPTLPLVPVGPIASSSQSTTTSELLEALADPSPGSDATPNNTVVLNQGLGVNVSALQPSQTQVVLNQEASLPPVQHSNTFVSPDLRDSGSLYRTGTEAGVLESMRQSLLRALAYLQPFSLQRARLNAAYEDGSATHF